MRLSFAAVLFAAAALWLAQDVHAQAAAPAVPAAAPSAAMVPVVATTNANASASVAPQHPHVYGPTLTQQPLSLPVASVPLSNVATPVSNVASPVSLAAGTPGMPATPQYGRWQSSFDEFAASDKQHAPDRNGVLFVGSSTIRLWSNLAQDFRDMPVVINRGFGGSTMADCERFARELVVRYQPRQVLVYAGDNDLAEGRSPQQVLQSFTNFVRLVRTELPETRITYISIKPSPSRAALMANIRETNALIGKYVTTVPNTGYIDIFNPMLTADGQTRPELFRQDMLHMNDAGYKLWQSLISSQLRGPGSAVDPAGLIQVRAPAAPAVTPATTPAGPAGQLAAQTPAK